MKNIKHKLAKHLKYLALFVCVSATINVADASVKLYQKEGELTKIPFGYVQFCSQYPTQCKDEETNNIMVEMNLAVFEELRYVNSYVNNTIKEKSDKEQYNMDEFWTYPKTAGDCEDFVIMKRHLLIEKGWPSSSLLITIVINDQNELHAILTVHTSEGDFVLDNLKSDVMLWSKVNYKYIKRQSISNSLYWVTIK